MPFRLIEGAHVLSDRSAGLPINTRVVQQDVSETFRNPNRFEQRPDVESSKV